MGNQPLVSVVMPSLDQGEFIEAAIGSVLGQEYSNVEVIVVDGVSQDGTLECLQRLAAVDSRLRVYSGSDSGPAQAVNRALDLSRGTLVGWLNADDLYAPGAVTRAVAALGTNPHWLMVYGHGLHIDEVGAPLRPYPTLLPETPIDMFAEGCFVCQPTVFFRRTLRLLLGPLDESLMTAFDFDYWLRAFKAFPERIGFVDAVQAYSRLHESCITQRLRRQVIHEGMQVLARTLGSAPKEWFLTYVDEQLALPPAVRGSVDLRARLSGALAEARPWLKADEFAELERRLEELLK